MKKLLFLLLLLLPLAAFGIYGYGKNLPETHEISRSALYDQPIGALWQAIADFDKLPGWSDQIEKVERQEDQEGFPVWRFYNKEGKYMDIIVAKSEEPVLLMTRIVETDMPVSGSWTFVLNKRGEETTELTLKEEGYVGNPLMRLKMKFFNGKEATVDGFLVNLGHKFGEKVEIR